MSNSKPRPLLPSFKTSNWQLNWSTKVNKLKTFFSETTKWRLKSTLSRETFRSIRKLRRNWLKDPISVKRWLRNLSSKSKIWRMKRLTPTRESLLWWASVEAIIEKERAWWDMRICKLIKQMKIWLTFWNTSLKKSKRNFNGHKENTNCFKLTTLSCKTRWICPEKSIRELLFWWLSSWTICLLRLQIFLIMIETCMLTLRRSRRLQLSSLTKRIR